MKTNKENEEMNIKNGSKKLLVLLILVAIVAVAGIVFTFAAGSTDITAPVTTSTVTGTKEAAPFTDYYKDSATVTLAATDPTGAGGGGGGSAQTLGAVAGESPLSATFVAGQPASIATTPFTENFDNGLSNSVWEIMPAPNGAGNVGVNNGILGTQVNAGGFASGVRTYGYADLSNSSQPVEVEVQTTIRSIGSAITFGIVSRQMPGDQGTPAVIGFRIVNQGQGDRILFGANSMAAQSGQVPQGFNTDLPLPSGLGWTDLPNRPFRMKIIYDNNLHTVQGKVDLNNNGIYDEANIDASTTAEPFTWNQPETQINMWAQSISDMVTPNPPQGAADWDNLITNIMMTIPATQDGYNLSRTGMAVNGSAYMDPAPMLGIDPGVVYWGQNGPQQLPAIIFGINSDIYAYQTNIDLSVFGAGPVKWTIYSALDPVGFAQVVAGLNGGIFGAPIPTTVDAFAKVFTYSGNAMNAITLPTPNEGSIVYNAGTGQADILPPTSSAPVISGVNKTYYRIGDTGNFTEYTAPVAVNIAGVNNFYYYSTDNAGNMETVQSIVVKVDGDTDGDTVYNNYDNCPTVMSTYSNGCPSVIQVNAENWTLKNEGDKNHPKSTKIALAGLPVKVYDYNTVKADFASCRDNWKEEDDGGEEGDGEDCVKPIDYKAIIDKYTPLYAGITDATGEVKISVYANDKVTPPVKYIVIGDYAGVTSYDKNGVKLVKKVHVHENKTKKVKMRLQTVIASVSDDNDKKCYATKKTRVNGSGNLDIIEPEYIDYTDAQEYYPIIFQSSDDFTAATAITPPEGWSADVTEIIRQIPPGATDTAQFTLIAGAGATVSTGVTTTISAVNDDKKPTVKAGKVNIDYQAKGGKKKNYKSEYETKKKDTSFKQIKLESQKSFMDQLKEKGDKNAKITQEIRNRDVLGRVKRMVKKIF